MWPFSPRNHTYIGVIFSDTDLKLSHIVPHDNSYQLRAYKTIPLNRKEIIHGIPFQVTTIASHIVTFIQTHSLKKPSLLFALDDTYLYNTFTDQINTTNTSNHIMCYQPLPSICSTMHYAVGISREQLFYYQLLACATTLPCTLITSINSCYVATISENRLSTRSIHTTEELHNFIASCKPFITTTHTISIKDQAAALGLYVQGTCKK